MNKGSMYFRVHLRSGAHPIMSDPANWDEFVKGCEGEEDVMANSIHSIIEVVSQFKNMTYFKCNVEGNPVYFHPDNISHITIHASGGFKEILDMF